MSSPIRPVPREPYTRPSSQETQSPAPARQESERNQSQSSVHRHSLIVSRERDPEYVHMKKRSESYTVPTCKQAISGDKNTGPKCDIVATCSPPDGRVNAICHGRSSSGIPRNPPSLLIPCRSGRLTAICFVSIFYSSADNLPLEAVPMWMQHSTVRPAVRHDRNSWPARIRVSAARPEYGQYHGGCQHEL